MPPPPPPPRRAGGYASHGGGYYGKQAGGSTTSTAARQRLGLSNKNAGGASSSSDDWYASPAPAPSGMATAAPPPAPAAAASSSSSGFYSMNTGGSNDNMYSNYGASNAYGGSSNAMSAGASSTGGGYYGGSAGTGGYAGASNNMTGAMGGSTGGYGASPAGAMSGTIGGSAPAPVPPSAAFGSNPNSGSSGQIGLGGSNSFEMGGAMSGSMGGPIGGPAPVPPAPTGAPHVFDPNAAVAKKKAEEQSNNANAMQSMDEDYENEPPLLEELGVNFPHIYSKSRAVLFPFGKHAKSLESGLIENDADLAGPLAFALGLGGELLLAGKMHFGYVYGFGVSGCLAMTLLLNLLNPNGAVSVWTVVSILGYALLPVNLLAGVNAIMRIHKLGKWGMIASVLTIAWCTTASARLFERGCNMRAQRFLVAYPTALLYSAFVMITIF